MVDRIWQFDSITAGITIAEDIVRELSYTVEMAPGIALGIEWATTEALTNVLDHSRTDHGFFMASLVRHLEGQRLQVCVVDLGVGHEAPSRARGAGFGLEGIRRIASATSGIFGVRHLVHSGLRSPPVNRRRTSKGDYPGTILTFEISIDAGLDLGVVLGADPVDLRREALDEAGGRLRLRFGGTPHANQVAERTGFRALNAINEGAREITLDVAELGAANAQPAIRAIQRFLQQLTERYASTPQARIRLEGVPASFAGATHELEHRYRGRLRERGIEWVL